MKRFLEWLKCLFRPKPKPLPSPAPTPAKPVGDTPEGYVDVLDEKGNPLGPKLTLKQYCNLQLQGSGFIDGVLYGYKTKNSIKKTDCSAFYSPSVVSGTVKFHKDPNKYGTGVKNWPITPMKSIAVDPKVIPYGSKVYIPALKGIKYNFEGVEYVHDGIVYAEDTGGAIKKNHIDFFLGPQKDPYKFARNFPFVKSKESGTFKAKNLTTGKDLELWSTWYYLPMYESYKADVVAEPTPEPVPEPTGEKIDAKLAIVVGHNYSSQGAVNYLGESEWSFNSRIAEKVKHKLEDLGFEGIHILKRPDGSYSRQVSHVAHQIENLGSKYAMCLHFNAASGKAMGCEVLIDESHTLEDDRVADYITDILNERYGFRERHNDGVKTVEPGHNGHGMLSAIRKTGCIPFLPEPAFGNHRSKESALIFEQEDKYVDVLVEALTELCKGNFK